MLSPLQCVSLNVCDSEIKHRRQPHPESQPRHEVQKGPVFPGHCHQRQPGSSTSVSWLCHQYSALCPLLRPGHYKRHCSHANTGEGAEARGLLVGATVKKQFHDQEPSCLPARSTAAPTCSAQTRTQKAFLSGLERALQCCHLLLWQIRAQINVDTASWRKLQPSVMAQRSSSAVIREGQPVAIGL